MAAARRRRGLDIDGIVLLDKPVGISSNQALQRARRLFSANKAGHTGNLDVAASGLLPLCFGEATKVSQFLLDADKRYEAEIEFGATTTTGDAEGEIVSRAATATLTAAGVQAAMDAMVGTQAQVPPMYSALKRAGRPLYELARAGIEVPRAPRQVTISEFRLHTFHAPRARVFVACSKGTYIRTLAEDLGAALGCGAHISGLRRLAAGPFSLTDAYTLEHLSGLAATGESLTDLLIPMDQALAHLPARRLDGARSTAIMRGQRVPDDSVTAPPGLCRLYGTGGVFIGIGESAADGELRPRRLLRTASA